MYKLLTGKEKVDYRHFFQPATTQYSMRGHSMKLYVERCRLNCRKKYSFSHRSVTYWNDLPQDVDAPSVNAFKNRLDKMWADVST